MKCSHFYGASFFFFLLKIFSNKNDDVGGFFI